MGFVKNSWKRKRNVRRLEKGINPISVHSNKLQRKLLDSHFYHSGHICAHNRTFSEMNCYWNTWVEKLEATEEKSFK